MDFSSQVRGKGEDAVASFPAVVDRPFLLSFEGLLSHCRRRSGERRKRLLQNWPLRLSRPFVDRCWRRAWRDKAVRRSLFIRKQALLVFSWAWVGELSVKSTGEINGMVFILLSLFSTASHCTVYRLFSLVLCFKPG